MAKSNKLPKSMSIGPRMKMRRCNKCSRRLGKSYFWVKCGGAEHVCPELLDQIEQVEK